MSDSDDEGLMDSAVLLLALGEEAAAEVFRHLGPKEVQKLGEIMAKTQSTTHDRVIQVLDRFKAATAGTSMLVENSGEYVRQVLTRALGQDKAGILIDRILDGGDTSGIESLKWMDAPSVNELIRNEHPQIIASVLVHLERDHASAIVALFPDRLKADVMLRIATLDGIQPVALKELNDTLSRLLASGDKMSRGSLGGSKTAAEILNFLGGAAEGAIMDGIRDIDPDLAQAIEDQMFVFDDLMKVDDKGIQLILREVQSDQLITALKGADPELREKIFKNMSQRAAETMREDLESKGPVKLSEVEGQQKEILKIVKRLADEGQLMLGAGGGDEFV